MKNIDNLELKYNWAEFLIVHIRENNEFTTKNIELVKALSNYVQDLYMKYVVPEDLCNTLKNNSVFSVCKTQKFYKFSISDFGFDLSNILNKNRAVHHFIVSDFKKFNINIPQLFPPLQLISLKDEIANAGGLNESEYNLIHNICSDIIDNNYELYNFLTKYTTIESYYGHNVYVNPFGNIKTLGDLRKINESWYSYVVEKFSKSIESEIGNTNDILIDKVKSMFNL